MGEEQQVRQVTPTWRDLAGMTTDRITQQARNEAFRTGYADGKAGRQMVIRWGTGGVLGHRYGMGYFHGRAHA